VCILQGDSFQIDHRQEIASRIKSVLFLHILSIVGHNSQIDETFASAHYQIRSRICKETPREAGTSGAIRSRQKTQFRSDRKAKKKTRYRSATIDLFCPDPIGGKTKKRSLRPLEYRVLAEPQKCSMVERLDHARRPGA
jgi:hypothetical protein